MAAGGVSFTAAFATVSASAAPSPAPQTTRVDLRESDGVVAGGRGSGQTWVLARDRQNESLVLYRVSDGGAVRRTALPLKDSGALGAVAVASGAVWVGAGDTVVRIEPDTGRATNVIRLDAPASAVPTAQRAPDGTILGWGQINSIAVDSAGTAWVARYAVPVITRIDGFSLIASLIAIPEATDPDRLISTSSGIWFTTNFGLTNQLGAKVGKLDPATLTVQLVSVVAAVIVPSQAGIETLGVGRNVIDPSNLRVTKGTMPREMLSLSSVVSDSSGNLIARIARANRLLIFDTKGRIVRAIDFEAGTFKSRGEEMAMVAPLAMLFSASDGAIWFAPRGGRSVYRAP
jgi:streptogramin lyase